MPGSSISLNNFRGLHVQANSFSAIPDGAFEITENVVFSQDGMLKKRRGFYTLQGSITNPLGVVEYNSLSIIAYATSLASLESGSLVSRGSANWTTINPNFAIAGNKLFVTTDDGVQVLEDTTAGTVLRDAGIPPALDAQVSLSGQAGVVPPYAQVGWRIVFGLDDTQGNRLLSAPSEFVSITNNMLTNKTATNASSTVTITSTAHGLTGTPTLKILDTKDSSGNPVTNVNGTYIATIVDVNTLRFTSVGSPSAAVASLSYGVWKAPTLAFTLPQGLSTRYFYQVYRTDATSTSLISPDEDSLKLAFEARLSSGDLSNGYLSLSDSVDDLFRSAYCYTNANTGSGISASNFPPPLAKDMAQFSGCLFFGNTQSKHNLNISLTSAAVMQNDDTLTIRWGTASSLVFTAKATENIANREFARTSGSGSVGFDIASTARSLCKVINRNVTAPVYAFYVSGPLDVPGAILLQSRDVNIPFSAQFSRASIFSPDINTLTNGSATTLINGLCWSKQEQPESVPAYQWMQVGGKDEAILRLVPLRDSLIIIKERSIWRVNGNGAFQATLLDGTVNCRAPKSVCVLNNAVMLYCNQGIASVSESSVSIISRAIEPLLTSVIGGAAFAANTTCVPYESERSLIVSTISKASSTAADVVYVYNFVSDTWTTWDIPFICGLVTRADDKLLYIDADGALKRERKNLNKIDYMGQHYSVSVVSVASDSKSAEIQCLYSTPAVGDCIVFNNIISLISAIDTTQGANPIITFRNRVTFVQGSADVYHYEAIHSRVRTAPITGGSAGVLKQFSEISLEIRSDLLTRCVLKFSNELSGSSSSVIWTGSGETAGWGLSGWGNRPFGDTTGIDISYLTSVSEPIRTFIPAESQKGCYLQVELTHSVAGESMDLQTMTLKARSIGSRVAR
jgi:hypothetical protein